MASLIRHTQYIVTSSLPFKIVLQLVNALICIENAEYRYMDITPENILYRCFKENKIKISLGDLGSIIPFEARAYRAYFQVPSDSSRRSVSAQIWLLGINILYIYKVYNSIFNWTREIISLYPTIEEYYMIITQVLTQIKRTLDTYKRGQNNEEIEKIKNVLDKIFRPSRSRTRFTLQEVKIILDDG